MNRGARKVQEMARRTDLRNDEVDSHFATEKMFKSFGVCEEGASTKILELLDSTAAGKVKLELWKEYPRRNYL